LLNLALPLLVAHMRISLLRRCFLMAMAAVAAASVGGCERKSQGVVQVLVIGGQPRLADPQRVAPSQSDSVLLANVAQGLVRFDARGQVEPGLAETWNVSDDGLSYIFRLANTHWSDGRRVTAQQVAQTLKRLIGPPSRNPVKDSFGAVEDVVAMTDRVLEIRLKQPRPNLLQLLAQPQMALVYGGGSGPFTIERSKGSAKGLRLVRDVETLDEEQPRRERLELGSSNAEDAVRMFAAGETDLVLGGTFVDLPIARQASLPRRALQFDPASGLFGLAPGRDSKIISDPEVRRLLSQAIDRDALVAALSVPGLVPRATVLEPGLDNMPDPAPPTWVATPIADRRAALAATARRLFAGQEAPTITVALPVGPGVDLLFRQLVSDWGAIGLTVRRSAADEPADLRLIDEVAPSTSANWFVRRFRCAQARICDNHLDELLEAARDTPVLAQRSALFEQAAREIDDQQLFIPIAAPIRWSLVSSRIAGFAGNRFAIHTLIDLEQRLDRTGD
jgi:peptide/nickel transport system substrate-binding protein